MSTDIAEAKEMSDDEFVTIKSYVRKIFDEPYCRNGILQKGVLGDKSVDGEDGIIFVQYMSSDTELEEGKSFKIQDAKTHTYENPGHKWHNQKQLAIGDWSDISEV